MRTRAEPPYWRADWCLTMRPMAATERCDLLAAGVTSLPLFTRVRAEAGPSVNAPLVRYYRRRRWPALNKAAARRATRRWVPACAFCICPSIERGGSVETAWEEERVWLLR